MPQEAGFRMGTTADDIQHIVLEIHYDNPGSVAGQIDNSGVILYYTDTDNARANDASTVVLGDPLVTFPTIPAGASLHHIEGVCPESCTRKRLGTTSLNVFASFLHMHSFGRQIYTSKAPTGELNRADSWNFEFQQITDVSYTINPGDSLHTHCTYDASTSKEGIRFGIASEEVSSVNRDVSRTLCMKTKIFADLNLRGIGNVHGLRFLLSKDPEVRALWGRPLCERVYWP